MNHSQDNPWKTIASPVVYENEWIKVVDNEVVHTKAPQKTYGTVHFKNYAIGILPLDEQGNTFLVGQYRYPTKNYSWEVPAGGGKLGVDPLVSAQRELLEETGIEANGWELILKTQLSNSVTDELSFSYLATRLTFKESEPELDEILQVKKIPFQKVYEMVEKGEIRDALSILTIQRAKLMGY